MADNIRATPQNPYTGALARGLRSLQQLAGQYQVDPRIPLLGGTSVDELLSLPGAASLAEDVSYYGPRALIRGGNVATGGIGTFRLDPRVADVADVAMNVTPLAAMAGRTATRGAMAAGRAGERLAERVVPQVMERGGIGAQLMQDMATGSRSQVIKPKGGNWLAGSVENAVQPLQVRVRTPGVNMHTEEMAASDTAMNRWLDQKLAKYIRNEMGTPEDPLRALAERGVLHTEIGPTGYSLKGPRAMAGFPEEGMGVSPLAKTWEDRADTFINQLHASDLTRGYPGTVEANPWLAKVPPQTRVYEMLRGAEEDLGFTHLVDELKNAINPTSGLPENLRWKYQDLDKVTVPQAVQRVADINAWRAVQKAEADAVRAMGPAVHTFKEYPEQGFKWVELRQPKETGKKVSREKTTSELEMADEGVETMSYEDIVDMVNDLARDEGIRPGTREFNEMLEDNIRMFGKKPDEVDESIKALEDALKYEGETMGHCVGGYCPDVIEGRSKIFSLRDKKGQPHVTIETRPMENYELEAAKMKRAGASPEEIAAFFENPPQEIVQIKGKANRAPNPEYLPAVQDFVRSGNWSKVGDLQNTGLISYKGEYRLPEEFLYRTDEGGWEPLVDVAKRAFPDSPAKQLNFYRGASELENDIKLKPQDEGFAEGGLVGGANFPTYDFDPARIDSIVGELHAMNAG